MLKAMGALLKLALFSIVILLAGQWISWDGRTLSQHVQAQFAHAEKSDTAAYMRGLARRVTEDARSGFEKKTKQRGHVPAATHAAQKAAVPQENDSELTDRTETQAAAPLQAPAHTAAQPQAEVRTIAHAEEQIPPSERQKLRALIRELNSSND